MPASVRRPASVYLIAMRRPPVQIVWFKRDLRVHDHAPLAEAAGLGPVLPLYVLEPGFWREPDASGRQLAFLRESLAELREALAALGQPLVVRVGEVEAVLEDLRQQLPSAPCGRTRRPATAGPTPATAACAPGPPRTASPGTSGARPA